MTTILAFRHLPTGRVLVVGRQGYIPTNITGIQYHAMVANTALRRVTKAEGWGNFQIEVLEAGVPLAEAKARKLYWIDQFAPNIFNKKRK